MRGTAATAATAKRAATMAIGTLGTSCLGLAFGAVVVGHLFLVPALAENTELVDANLARALAQPLAMRCAELVLLACVILAALAQPWLRHRAATSLALLAAGVAACDRLVLLPEAHERWGRVDLVAMRPLDRIAEATQLSLVHHGALALIVALLLGLAVVSSLPPRPA